ncbi:MAG: hypothetical protein ACXQTX_03805 [Candidatus Syntropharchaeia archaeon]
MEVRIEVGEEYLLEMVDGKLVGLSIWSKAGDYYGVSLTPLTPQQDPPLYAREKHGLGWMRETDLKSFLGRAKRILLVVDKGGFSVKKDDEKEK